MGRHLKYSEVEADAAKLILADASTKMLTAALVRIIYQCEATLEDAAKALGISRSTALRYSKDFRSMCAGTTPQKRPHGGRRNGILPLDEERAFIAGWKERARAGEHVTIALIAEALKERLGRSVSKVTVCNMLKRNGGW